MEKPPDCCDMIANCDTLALHLGQRIQARCGLWRGLAGALEKTVSFLTNGILLWLALQLVLERRSLGGAIAGGVILISSGLRYLRPQKNSR
jgi:hypothetical protein